jgi:anaerobic ribonucleoside-triphosphate reductase activating protein
MRFRCGAIQDSTIDGIGVSLNVYFQGCSRNCVGCHNKELQDFDGGFEIDTDEIIKILEMHPGFYESIVLTGGDPAYQWNAVRDIASRVSISIVLYTGEYFKNIPKDILSMENIVKVIDGPYREDLKTDGFPASMNQGVHTRIDKNSWMGMTTA